MSAVHEYVQDYEFRFEGGQGYTPTEPERAMLEDAITGYLGDLKPIDDAVRVAFNQGFDAAIDEAIFLVEDRGIKRAQLADLLRGLLHDAKTDPLVDAAGLVAANNLTFTRR